MKTIIRQGIRFGTLAASLLGAASASAQDGTTQAYCSPNTSKDGGFSDKDTYDPLSNTSGTLLVRGDAKITPEGTLLLTTSASDLAQSGNVTTKDQLDFNYTDAPATTKARPFHTYFTFSIGPNIGLKGGAGLAFLAHNNDAGTPGAGGNGLGYGGLTTSFAIEFDTFSDPPTGGKFEDLKDNHIGFMVNGLPTEHPATFVPTESGVVIPFATATRDKFHVWIDYAGGDSRQFDVYFSRTKEKPKTPIAWDLHKAQYAGDASIPFPDSFNMVDLLSKAGRPPKAYIGFSASTYGPATKNDHVIHEWEYSTTGDIPCACQGATACAATETTPACSAGTGTMGQGICVECTVMDQGACKGKNQVCNPKTETCGPCMMDAECSASYPETPACAVSGGQKSSCVECNKNEDCKGTNPLCDLTKLTCITTCTSVEDCTPGKVCDRNHQCIDTPPESSLVNDSNCALTPLGAPDRSPWQPWALSLLSLAALGARRCNTKRGRRSSGQPR